MEEVFIAVVMCKETLASYQSLLSTALCSKCALTLELNAVEHLHVHLRYYGHGRFPSMRHFRRSLIANND